MPPIITIIIIIIIIIQSQVLDFEDDYTQDFETSVPTNSPSQDSFHPDNQFSSKYVTPRFKPFSVIYSPYWALEVSNTHFICCMVALFMGSTWSIEESRLLVSGERCDGT